MDRFPKTYIADLLDEINSLSKQKSLGLLSEMDDRTLWSLYRKGSKEALHVLYQKYHRQIEVLVYNRLQANENITFHLVQESFSDFIDKVLEGEYNGHELKKNFMAFGIHCTSLIAKSKARLAVNSKVSGLHVLRLVEDEIGLRTKMDESIDLQTIINLIPNISNNVYRRVLNLIFKNGYTSKDLTEVFGKREKAYDNRSRALKAFRELLEKEGILDELR